MEQVLKFGVSVVTTDERDVGTLHRVVIDDTTHAVTGIVVQRRLLESGNLLKPGGWEKPRDQLVPIAGVLGAAEDEVRISPTEDEFLALPPYVVGEVPEPDATGSVPPGFAAEDIAMRAGALLGGGLYEPPRDEIENRAPSERHLSRGAAVWRREPHTHLGDVDRIVMDDATNQATALVIRHGALFAHEVVLDMQYVVDLLDDLVHVDIPQAVWEQLPAYSPQE